jgi:hypothetical protein
MRVELLYKSNIVLVFMRMFVDILKAVVQPQVTSVVRISTSS